MEFAAVRQTTMLIYFTPKPKGASHVTKGDASLLPPSVVKCRTQRANLLSPDFIQ